MPEETENKIAPRKFRRYRVDQWGSGIKMTWSPQQIKSALISHHEGDFEAASKLAIAMLQDDELPEDLAVATNLIAGAEFVLKPTQGEDGEPDPASQAVADDWTDEFQRMNPPGEMAKMLAWDEMVGLALGVYDWTRKDGKWTPRLRALNPENLRFDDSRKDPKTGLHGAWVFHARSGEEIVTPGDGRWVLWSGGRESWLSCGVRALGFLWLMKQQATRDLSRYMERHGLPIVTVKVPTFSADGTEAAVLNDVKSLGSDTTMTLPSHMMPDSGHEVGFEVDLVEATDQAFEVFFRTMDRSDRKLKMYFLGTNTAELEGTAGSRATQSSGRDIMMQKAQERYNRVKGFVRNQMFAPLLPLMGKTLDPSIIPDPVYLIEGDEDLRVRAETVKAFGQALGEISAAGYEVTNLEKEAAQYGLQVAKKPEPVQEPPLPNTTGQGEDIPKEEDQEEEE